jgi:hypothetical protein
MSRFSDTGSKFYLFPFSVSGHPQVEHSYPSLRLLSEPAELQVRLILLGQSLMRKDLNTVRGEKAGAPYQFMPE